MNRRITIFLALVLAFLLPSLHAQQTHSFRVENGKFLLDGQPYQIISGEMHSPRIPRDQWRARFRMARAMGLNTITTYVFWNTHEPEPGAYDFSGQHDIAEFIREAGEEGLHVILRPGPYVCAEWEWGGYPSWLLKDHGIVVRSTDPRFMVPARRWLMRLGKELAPLQIGNGGPIIAVQVENEYGSFGKDHAYMEQIHQALVDAGFTKALLYTADGPEEVPDGSLPELPVGINFGAGDAKDAFAQIHKMRPGGPFLASEYWAGWFDHWGEKHHVTDAQQQADEIKWMLTQGYSVSIYMFNGGTNFGWMNGANISRDGYQPTVTSYDYDAPLDESGRTTPKYFLFRKAIEEATDVTPPPVPTVPPAITIPSFPMEATVSLWKTLPAPVSSPTPLSMEDIGQAYGYILYRTTLSAPVSGKLVLDQLHDYALIFANGKLIGKLDRRLKQQDSLDVNFTEPNTQLDILVENTGRINFSRALLGERQGITHEVTLNGTPVTGWQIYSLPMHDPAKLHYRKETCTGPCFYRGSFKLDKTGDTFLDTEAFTKGFVWINGHELGRVWDIGPQKALYVPGSWLQRGKNEVIVFDLDGGDGKTLYGRDQPLLNAQPSN